MKHGDKAKGKPAKAKASGKKGGSKVAAKSKASPRQSAKPKKAATKASSAERGGNGQGRSRGGVPENVGFTNPIVAAAFKRAVKKFPIAFKRLAD
jgi:uncharacterized protein YgiB involved in biofilm formation